MGKRYFCDYCNKYFQDSLRNRRRHMKALSHQRNKKAYFDSIMVNGRQYGNSLLLNRSGEEILQIWLKDNPKVKQQYLNNIAESDPTKSYSTDQSDIMSKQSSGANDVEPLSLLPTVNNILESLEKIDRSHLPPSLSGDGSGFEGGVMISEWG